MEIETLSLQVKDRKEGMRKLTASFLNEVMQHEAENQIQARRYERTSHHLSRYSARSLPIAFKSRCGLHRGPLP
jgi:transposase-like protein